MTRLYLYVCLLLWPAFAKAQLNLNPIFDHIDPEKFGVSRCWSQAWDKNGGLWAGTDKGLLYYNGYAHKLWRKLPGDTTTLGGNMLFMYMDKKDRAWIGHALYGGLTRFDTRTQKVTHYWPDTTRQNTMPHDVSIVTCFEDSKGTIWVLTWGAGLYKLDEKTGTFTRYHRDPDPQKPRTAKGPACNFIKHIAELPDGRFFVSYFENAGIGAPPDYFDPATGLFTGFPLEEYKAVSEKEMSNIRTNTKIVHATYFDDNNGLWLATYSGLDYFDLKNKTVKRISGRPIEFTSLNLENTRSITADDKGMLWIGTTTSGIMVVNPYTFAVGYIVQNDENISGLSDNTISTIRTDPTGNIWISAANGVLNIYHPFRQQFRLKSWKDLKVDFADRSSQTVPVSSMLEHKDKIYISNENGIAVYNLGTQTLEEPIRFNKGNDRLSLHGASTAIGELKFIDDGVYFSNDKQTIKYNLLTKKFTRVNTPWISILYPFQEEVKDIYYVGLVNDTAYGILRYNEASGKTEPLCTIPDNSQPSASFSYILPGNKAVMGSWPFTRLLVSDFTKKTTEVYGTGSGVTRPLPAFTIKTICPHARDGSKLWLCTDNGLFLFDVNTGQCDAWNNRTGLKPGENVEAMVWDRRQHYWICTEKQLIRWDPATGNAFKFTNELGLRAGRFADRVPQVDKNGRLYFATSKGLLAIDPVHLRIPVQKPVLSLYAVTVKEDTLKQDALKNFAAGKTTLGHNDNFLIFDFNTNETYMPVPAHFYYRLSGLDTTWQDNGTSNRIRYTNLSHGEYVLEVKCVNVYGVQSAVLKIPFAIARPFWKTWWFYVLIVTALVVVVVIIIRVRERALRYQREALERKVAERTAEVVEKAKEITLQKEVIEEKNKELTDSIHYAQRIQQSILPDHNQISKKLPGHFIYFKPKDIVSGDFYWYSAQKDSILVAVVDCTGHGVPGGFMSMLGAGLLNQIVNEEYKLEPADILNHLRDRVIMALKQTGAAGENRDGMDISLCRVIPSANTLQYAGANNPLYMVRNGALQELKPDKQPIGIHVGEKMPFTQHQITLQPGDQLYMASDGYADQFGGPKGKKFKSANFEKLLVQISGLTMAQQHETLNSTFMAWKGDYEQLDDICVVGVKW